MTDCSLVFTSCTVYMCTFLNCDFWIVVWEFINNCIYIKHLESCNSCSIKRIRDHTAARYADVDKISCNVRLGPTYIFLPGQNYTYIKKTYLLASNITLTDNNKCTQNLLHNSTDLKRNCRFRFETSIVSMSTT